MADKLIFVVTHADEKADLATIPFALGNSALAMDTEAIIILQSTGVFLGTKDYARHIHAQGFPPLQELINIYMEEGGKLYACEPCMRARNIGQEDLLDNIVVVSGPTLVDVYLEAKNVVVY